MTVSLDTSSSPTLHDPASLLDYFTELADPRREQGRIHRLDEIIFISICAVTCGADSWEEIASYAHSKIDWLQTVLTWPGGVPRTTPSDVSSACSTRWPSRSVSTPG